MVEGRSLDNWWDKWSGQVFGAQSGEGRALGYEGLLSGVEISRSNKNVVASIVEHAALIVVLLMYLNSPGPRIHLSNFVAECRIRLSDYFGQTLAKSLPNGMSVFQACRNVSGRSLVDMAVFQLGHHRL